MKTLHDLAQYIDEILSQGIEIHQDSPVHLALKQVLNCDEQKTIEDSDNIIYELQLEAVKQLYIKAYTEEVLKYNSTCSDFSTLIHTIRCCKAAGYSPEDV